MADTKTSAARGAQATSSGALRGAIGSPWRNTLTIAGREFRAYFNSPIGYIVIGTFTLFLGVLFFFLFGFLVLRRASLQPMFTAISWLLPMLCAAVSMRSFAEERRLGTMELLITLPVRDYEVIFGKFLGAMGLLAIALFATIAYPIAVSRMGDLDMGPVWGGYIGLLLVGGSYIAIGMMVSSYTTDQITAFFISFFAGYILFLVDKGLIFMGWWNGKLIPYFRYVCFDVHFKSIARGVIDMRDLIFFTSVIAACLLVTARSLSSRRWS